MTALRRVLMGFAILHLLFTALTATLGLFADGGAVYSRLIISALHPLTALAILLLVFAPRLSAPFTIVVTALLVVNIIADVTLSALIALDILRGDWELPLFFAIVPAMMLIYAINLIRFSRSETEDS